MQFECQINGIIRVRKWWSYGGDTVRGGGDLNQENKKNDEREEGLRLDVSMIYEYLRKTMVPFIVI